MQQNNPPSVPTGPLPSLSYNPVSLFSFVSYVILKCCAQPSSSDLVKSTNKRKRSNDNESGDPKVAVTASLAMMISANRAQREDNRAAVELHSKKREVADVAATIVNMRDAIGGVELCPPCWLTGQNPNHSSISCSYTAEGWSDKGSGYKSFRGHLNILPGHCFRCCLPQVSCLALEFSPGQLLNSAYSLTFRYMVYTQIYQGTPPAPTMNFCLFWLSQCGRLQVFGWPVMSILGRTSHHCRSLLNG